MDHRHDWYDWDDPRKSVLLAPGGDVRLEQLDDLGHEWYGEGPGGDAIGDLAGVLDETLAPEADAEWRAVVCRAIANEIALRERRSMLLVMRGGRTMFHAARSASRESIDAHGLDWTRMARPGIAGSPTPEYPGVYVTSTLEDAEWFCRMGGAGHCDVWSVDTAGMWLEGARDCDNGGGDWWMIVPAPVPRSRIALVATNVGRA